MPKKLFDNAGKEIKSVFQLVYDQAIWLSFGEPWRTPYSQLSVVTYQTLLATASYLLTYLLILQLMLKLIQIRQGL